MSKSFVIMKEVTLLFVACLLISLTSAAPTKQEIDEAIQRQMRELELNRRTLSYLKNLLGDVENSIAGVQKRTCLFNAGMSHSCDYKDIMGLIGDTSYWRSDMSPGKRRKRGSLPFLFPDVEQDKLTA